MRDPDYRRWCRDKEPCVMFQHTIEARLAQNYRLAVATECRSPFGQTDPAHTQNNGMSSKGPDSSCVPMCRKHHLEYDAGREAFEKKYGIDMKAKAEESYARYRQEQAA